VKGEIGERAMKKQTVFFFLGVFLLSLSARSQGIRRPVWSGQFYDSDKEVLSRTLDRYLSAPGPGVPVPGRVRALIVPHAGYIYSGKTAAAAYRLVQGTDVDTVVILGPSHRVGFEGCSIYPRGGFETPLGVAEVDARLAQELIRASGFSFIPEAHAEEHSLEVQVPFIQKTLPRAKIVPVVMGIPSEETVRTLAGALARVLKDQKALVIASTDMSHFLRKSEANALDKNTIALVTELKTNVLLRKIERDENILCGGAAVVAALLYAQKLGETKVAILDYADSADAGGAEDRVVGYFAAAVTTTEKSPGGGRLGALLAGAGMLTARASSPQAVFSLSAEEKKELLRLARQAVELYVRERKVMTYETAAPNLKAARGAFVTLRRRGDLRGCIGFIEAAYPLYLAVLQCAIYAATEDARFDPVSADELKGLDYEISVLTPLQKIDNPGQVQVGKHGLVIAQGGRRGLLLPQVPVENNWDREEFLAQACLKAGLPPEAWKKGAEIFVFEAIVFDE
jgi:AmmeMemoRadiSam system protein B/AmmeMemoRadiSam system protein A